MLMTLKNRHLAAMLCGLMALATSATSRAQTPGGSGGGGSGSGRDFAGDMRQRFSDRMKEMMGADEDEWKILSPKIERVQQLQRAATSRSGMSMLFGRNGSTGGGGRGPGGSNPSRDFSRAGGPGGGGSGASGGGNAPSAQQSPVEVKAKELQASVDNKSAAADELKLKLAALREARAQAKADMLAAQEELRELLTVRQESILVMMGVLD